MNPCFRNADEWINWSNNANVTSLTGLMVSINSTQRPAAFHFSLFLFALKCFMCGSAKESFLCAYIYIFVPFWSLYLFTMCLFALIWKMNAVAGQKEVGTRPDIWYFSRTRVRYRTDPCSNTRTNAVFYCTVAPSHWWTDVLDSGRAGVGFLPIYLIYDLECSFHGDLWTQCD